MRGFFIDFVNNIILNIIELLRTISILEFFYYKPDNRINDWSSINRLSGFFIIMSQFKSGIYKITINDYYIYIGQSVDVKRRWSSHLNELKQNKHYNKKFQSVFNKYSDKIKYEVVEYCDVDKLDEREMYWISYYGTSNTNHGLNMGIGGDSNRKFWTKEESEAAALEARKKYYNDNIEKLREYSTQWYNNNKEKIKKYNKEYHIKNKEKILSYVKQYQQQHREEIRRKRGILTRFERYKLRFEKRYNCSRPLTSEEWNTWRTDKSVSGNYSKENAIRYLKTLSNITFTIPTKK